MGYDGPERRHDNKEFEIRVNKFIDDSHTFQGELREFMKNQALRCSNHAVRLTENEDAIIDLRGTREYCKGVLKTIGLGLPAVGSLAWASMELGKLINKLKGGG